MTPEKTLPRVHAVIVHHRGLDMLDVCLRSLLASQDVQLDVVIVSNGCEEPLPEVVETSSRVHVTAPASPVGFSEANNLGAAWAREHLDPADALYFVNNDTESRPETLAQLLAAMVEHGAAVAGPLTMIHASPEHINSVGLRITEDAGAWDDGIGQHLETYGELPGVREMAAVTGSALLIDAATFEQIEGWLEVYQWYYEDIDLCLRVWKRGGRVIHVPQAVILHRISATMSEGSDRKVFYFRRNRLLLGFLHWPLRPLGRLLHRAVVSEVLRTPWAHSATQRRALRDLVLHLPRYLALRLKLRGDASWSRFLEPIGSVPVITLPELTTADSEDADEDESDAPEQLDPALWDGARQLAENDESRRFLVLGWGPLPAEEARMHFAPGARTWQLAAALITEGHRVCVACARMPGAYFEPSERAPIEVLDDVAQALVGETAHGKAAVFGLDREVFDAPGTLESLLEAFRPHAVVGATPVASERAVAISGELPVWVDLFGDPLAEAQAKAMVEDGDLSAYLHLMNRVLERGDAFSAVSERQKWSAVGQLGLAGRLGAATGGHDLVHVLPCAAILEERAEMGEDSPDDAEDAPPDFPEDTLLALWSGSFNTWCDVETLFAGVEAAMRQEPRLVFVATGGAVQGHDESTHHRLVELIAGSRHGERWRLLGGLPRRAFERLRDRADFGLVTEKNIYERALGSSGRILDWLSHGRPVLCTGLSEIGQAVDTEGLGLTYRAGDAEHLAKRLLELCRLEADERHELGRRGREHVLRHFSIEASTRPLRRWAREPRRAPDAGLERADYLLAAAREAVGQLDEAIIARHEAEARWREAEARFQGLRSELGDIHQSRMWKTWMLLYDLKAWLTPWKRPRAAKAGDG